MRKALVVLVTLLVTAAFVSGVMAQGPKTDKPAAASEKPKAKAAAPKPVKGTVAAYEQGKMIAVKVKDKEMKFDIAADAKIKGEVKEGSKATVAYKKDGNKMVATSISVPAPKKSAPPKKAPEKAPEKK